LRGGGVDAGANTAALRALLKCRRGALVRFRLPRLADQLVDRRHSKVLLLGAPRTGAGRENDGRPKDGLPRHESIAAREKPRQPTHLPWSRRPARPGPEGIAGTA